MENLFLHKKLRRKTIKKEKSTLTSVDTQNFFFENPNFIKFNSPKHVFLRKKLWITDDENS